MIAQRETEFSGFNDVMKLAMAYRSSKPLLVALHYDLFSWIDRGLRTPERLRGELRLDRRAVAILLDALVALGLLTKSGGRYANTPLAKRYLVAGGLDYVGNNLKYQEQTWAAWSDLRFVLKSGRPNLQLLDWIHRDDFTEGYIRAMGDVARRPARDLAAKLDLRGVRRTLDVGCGSGAYSAALVERAPSIEAVLLDLPRTLHVTRRLLRGHPHEGRFRFRCADFLRDSFGREEFDLVVISNVTHVESAANNRRLVAKAYRALRPGGRLVIHDYVSKPGKAGARFTAMLALHLLVFTGRGNVYTLEEYADWMRASGLRRIAYKPVARGSLSASVGIIGQK